jgi:predicted Rossmann fold nucleotide-binding protein DprA/Smf involved in DNA uptake
MNDVEKRLALFAHIEPGTSFWGREISERGASATYDRLLGSGYDRVKYAQLIEKVTSFNAAHAMVSIDSAGATLITPSDSDWPQSVDDLEVPPIALIVKGDTSILSHRALAIVGTRNRLRVPTIANAR